MNKHIDHTRLDSGASYKYIVRLCQEAKKFEFRGVCVNPCWVSAVNLQLRDNDDLKIITVIGFPLGANETSIKIAEAKLAVEHGADELDVVWNVGNFLDGKYLQTSIELTTLVGQVAPIPVKVIVETSCFSRPDDWRNAYKIVEDCGAFCIKTSTGYGLHGATLTDVLVFNILGDLKIKASGGIHSYFNAKIFLDNGADIIGTSHGIEIIRQKAHKLYNEEHPFEEHE